MTEIKRAPTLLFETGILKLIFT